MCVGGAFDTGSLEAIFLKSSKISGIKIPAARAALYLLIKDYYTSFSMGCQIFFVRKQIMNALLTMDYIVGDSNIL